MYAAKVTYYRGQRYRSRLEARWAAFFDILGFPYVYEPFDLTVPDSQSTYTPDFVLRFYEWFIVEVKPAQSVSQAKDMVSKQFECMKGWPHSATVVGVSWNIEPGLRSIGPVWRNDGWDGEYGPVFVQCNICNQTSLADGGDYTCRVSGCNLAKGSDLSFIDEEELELWWREAGNEVQWKGSH